MEMGHGNGLASLRRGWIFKLLRVGYFMVVILFAQVTSEDQIGVPTTGLLCVSDCATCPVTCTHPPPSSASLLPPSPTVYYSPPKSYYAQPPPPSTPSYSGFTPPPPFNYMDIPSVLSPPSPPTAGSRGYSYPYYYFYASKAASLRLPASFSFFLLLLLFSHVVYLCW